MHPITLLEVKMVTELGAKSLIEPRLRPAIESKVEPAMKPKVKLAEIEESSVSIAFIIVINVSLNGLHNLIKIYNNKK